MNQFKIYSLCALIFILASSCSRPAKNFSLESVSGKLVTGGFELQEVRSFFPKKSSGGLSTHSGYILIIKSKNTLYNATVHPSGKINIYPDDKELKKYYCKDMLNEMNPSI